MRSVASAWVERRTASVAASTGGVSMTTTSTTWRSPSRRSRSAGEPRSSEGLATVARPSPGPSSSCSTATAPVGITNRLSTGLANASGSSDSSDSASA